MKRLLWGTAFATIWALAAAVLAGSLTVPAGVVASVAGVAAGLLAARKAAGSRLRLSAVWLVAMVAFAALILVAQFITGAAVFAALLQPSGAYQLRETLTWLIAPFLAVSVLRTSSLRHQTFVVLELTAVSAVFAGVFAAHRGGFINRPYLFVDPLWARGYDPLPAFLAIGVAIAGALVVMAAHRGSRKRSFFDVILILALLAGIFLVFPVGKLKNIPPPGGGESGQSQQKGGKGGGQQSGESGQQSGGSGQQSEGPMSSFANQPSGAANSPVAVVLFRDDYDSPLGYYYFRQAAFSQFNGQRLVQDTSGRADKDIAESFPSKTVYLASIGGQESTNRPTARPYFKTLDTTVALMAEHTRPFLLVNAQSVSPRANPDPKRFQRAYDARSSVLVEELPGLTKFTLGLQSWTAENWKHYTEGPSDPRYADLAQRTAEILKPEYRSLPIAQALAVKLWLEKNGTYSLDSQHESAGDPLADFLFGNMTGHCVYFAHAACLLMRARGIPARVGAGYAVDGRNRGGGSSLLVRERDAHAWPEIYLEGLGWIPFDISPEKSLAPPMDAPDQGLQQMLGEMVRQGAGNPKDEQNPPSRGDLQEFLKQVAKIAGIALMLLFAAVIVLLYAAKLYRRNVPFFCRAAHLPRLAYRASLDCLADSGRVRRFGQTREAFARSLANLFSSFSNLTAIHLDQTLGRGSLVPIPSRCLELYSGAVREVAKSTPWWRRFLGAVNPVSWLKVK